MIDAPETAVDSQSPVDAPVELYCVECGYNLSGTVGDRCSECGWGFDRAALVEWTTGIGQALPGEPLSILASSLFSPSRLGRRLPPRPDPEAARRYSLTIRLLACAVIPAMLMLVLAVAGRESLLLRVLFMPFPMLIASAACEGFIAALLAECVDTRAVARPHRYEFWHALCRCFAGHLLISVTVGCLVVGGALLFQSAAWVYAASLMLFGAGLWWWHCLGRAIVARSSAPARAAVLCLIPVIAGLAITLGFGLGMVEGLLAATLFDFHF